MLTIFLALSSIDKVFSLSVTRSLSSYKNIRGQNFHNRKAGRKIKRVSFERDTCTIVDNNSGGTFIDGPILNQNEEQTDQFLFDGKDIQPDLHNNGKDFDLLKSLSETDSNIGNQILITPTSLFLNGTLDNIFSENISKNANEKNQLSTHEDLLSTVDQKELTDPALVIEAVIGNTRTDSNTPAKRQRSIHNIENESTTALIKTEKSSEKEGTPKEIHTPSVGEILRFAIPGTGVFLCNPLLSLIDTSAVGLLSGTAQQAALNPAVVVTDYTALLIAFMYTATTNLVAGARECETGTEGKSKTSKTLITSLQLSSYIGAGLGAFLILVSKLLIKALVGNDNLDPSILSAAARYVHIRALGMPAAAVIGSAQSACLALKDVKSPLYVLLAAAAVNFLGDVIFVRIKNPWIGGAAGAAWATVFSQYVALFLFIKWLTVEPSPDESNNSQVSKINLTEAIMELTTSSKKGRSRRKKFREALLSLKEEVGVTRTKVAASLKPISSFLPRASFLKRNSAKPNNLPSRGFLAGEFNMKDLVKFPHADSAREFLPFVIPVTTTSVGRVSSFAFMSHVVSSSLGAIGMAAHHIVASIFYSLCPIADSLNLTAQSFIPALFERKKSPSRSVALEGAFRNFGKAALIFGVLMAGCFATTPLFGHMFTNNPFVTAQVYSAVPLFLGILGVHGIVCAGEGLLLGQKDLSFLARAYAAFFVAVPFCMLRVKKAALSSETLMNISSVWKVFLFYQIARGSLWILRLLQLNSRIKRDVSPLKSS